MTARKILAVLGLALAGPFSIAQEIVTSGNQKAPHQPPIWFVRMANPESVYPQEIDFYFGVEEARSSFGRVTAGSGIKYFCGVKKTENGGLEWQFCDM